MADTEREDHYYHPGGVPVSLQARRLGFEMPTWVSTTVWKEFCIWKGSSRYQTNTDKRVHELMTYCYEGMMKRLAGDGEDAGFVWFPFKLWYWPPNYQVGGNRKRKKKKRARLGARLFLDPTDGSPWLYIFDIERDNGSELEKGESPDGESEEDRTNKTESGGPGYFDGAGVDPE